MFGHYLIHPEGDSNSNEDWNEIEKDFLTSFDVKFKFSYDEEHSFDQHLAYICSDDYEIVMPTKNFNERDVYRMFVRRYPRFIIIMRLGKYLDYYQNKQISILKIGCAILLPPLKLEGFVNGK